MADFTNRTEVDEVLNYLAGAAQVLNHFAGKLANDQVYMKTAKETRIFDIIRQIQEITSNILQDPNARVKQFNIQQG